jgi:1-aminocyclopropane-1-carboxylate deaminase
MMSQFVLPAPRIEKVSFPGFTLVSTDVLRLDEIHPVISGNKWYKLKEYLDDALSQEKKTILTFGGAFSNHIVATAAACKNIGLQAVGLIRGERPPALSHTLQHAVNDGMRLFFLSREEYRKKSIPAVVFDQFKRDETYIINEGGYGYRGVLGAKTILENLEDDYTHILAAVGTGTTLAGLVTATLGNTHVTGIPVLKNNISLQEEIEALIPAEKKRFTLIHDFHFGGYAKKNKELINFMNTWYEKTGIPSDFVYTGKLFFAADQLLKRSYFPAGSRLLIIHSGGLQGNESLPKGTLIF